MQQQVVLVEQSGERHLEDIPRGSMANVELSVFALGSSMDITIDTLALTGVVGFTVIFEMCAHRMEHHLEGTPYMGMLAKIYKELMIMGVLSFGVFLTIELGGNTKNTEGFHAFEFAHIVIFFTALIFVMQACLMMIFSAKLKNRYERSTNISVDHLLSIYSLHRKSKVFHARWLPLSDLREVMEFKIVHAFFRTTFALPTSFDFALYMREASDSYILSLVDVEATTWLILAAVYFLNLARVKGWQAIGFTSNDDGYDDQAADDHVTDDHRRWLAESSYVHDNTGSDGELMFTTSGWILLGIAIGNYVMSRWSEIKLLRKAGCDTTDKYNIRLCVIEKQYMEAKHQEEKARQKGSSSNNLERLKLQLDQARGQARDHHRQRQQDIGGGDDGELLHRKISRHLDQAKRHAKAVTSGYATAELKRRLNSSPGGGGLFRSRSSGSKILPEEAAALAVDRLHREQTDIDLTPTSEGWRSPGSVASKSLTSALSSVSEVTRNSRQGSSISTSKTPGHGGASISIITPDGAELVGVTEEAERAGAGNKPTLKIESDRAVESQRRQEHSRSPRTTGLMLPAVKAPRIEKWIEAEKVEVVAVIEHARDVSGPVQVRSTTAMKGVEEEEKDHTKKGGETGCTIEHKEGNEDEHDDTGVRSRISRDPSFSQKMVVKTGVTTLMEDDECHSTGADAVNDVSSRDLGSPDSSVYCGNVSMSRRASISIQHKARHMSVSARRLTARLTDATKVARKMSRTTSSTPKLTLYNDISDIYFLSSPMLFHKTLDVLLLLCCTYLALWVVNFLPVANAKSYSFLRHGMMLLPAAGVFFFNALSVKTSSLLLAITAMDPEVIGKVLDEQIDQEKLVVQFRERLISRLDEIGLGKSGLAALFEEMDIRRKGELTITELSNMLFKLNFHASKEKYGKLFNIMDKNRLGVVSYHQLFQLVFDAEAAAQEAMALTMKGKMHAIK